MLTFLFRWLGRWPLPALHAAGALAGLLTYWSSGRYRRRIAENMAQALGRPATRRERWTVARETGKQILEMPFVWLRPMDDVIAKVVQVDGLERLRAHVEAGRPVLALTPHLGCFEITSLYVGITQPVTIMYRPPKQRVLEPFLRQGRQRGLVDMVPADLSGVRRFIKELRACHMVGLLPDQAPGVGEGIWSPFFGRPAYTMTLAARLSEVGKTQVLFFWGERLPRGRGWRLRVIEPTEPIEGSLEERVHAINRELERVIMKSPSQYLWGYNRYKVPAGAPRPEAAQ
ncbi:MAG: lysophospholipid acyltransferase family protein [Rhodocyclaceae bacterium]|jgi:Kdo2-lipid IVA lauroyltransferase/acyltransferase